MGKKGSSPAEPTKDLLDTANTDNEPPPIGSALYAQWVVDRPELRELSESIKTKLQWQLGSPNLKRLLDCKRSFEDQRTWIMMHRGALSTADADGEVWHEAECRLLELQVKPCVSHVLDSDKY